MDIIKSPQYRYISSLNEGIWEISVPAACSLEWSIVLSRLSSNSSLEPLHSHNGKQLDENIKRAMDEFNPFKDRYISVENKFLEEIVMKLSSNLKSSNAYWEKLVVTENLMQCKIALFKKDKQVYPSNRNVSPDDVILIFSEENGAVKFNFGLKASRCLCLRKTAFEHILENKVDVEKFKKLLLFIEETDTNENFLITLLKSDINTIACDIYMNSPTVIRLKQAGFEIDPRSTDSEGLSAFFHALLVDDTNKLCKLLYEFALDYPYSAEKSYKKINSVQLDQIRSLRQVLRNDLSVLNNFKDCENHEIIQKTLNNLLNMTIFLIEIDEKILEIEDEENEFIEDSEFQKVGKTRDLIVYILDTYLKLSTSPVNGTDVDASQFQNYKNYKTFLDTVDFITSMRFFNNIHRLKSKLKLSDVNDYERIESTLFIIVLSVYFSDIINNAAFFQSFPSQTQNNFYKILLKLRENYRNEIKFFCSTLKSTTLIKDNLRENVHTDENFIILDSYPEIKDYLLIWKLEEYLGYAEDITEIKETSVFAIERILHVLGDFIVKRTKKDNYIKWFVSLSLPESTRKVLRDIRNKLSHLDGHSRCVKLDYESDFLNKFRPIQDDIINIYQYLKPLFYTVNLRMKIYFEKILETHLQIIDPTENHDSIKANVSAISAHILENSSATITEFKGVFKIILKNSIEELKGRQLRESSEIRCILDPLNAISQCILGLQEQKDCTLLEISKILEEVFDLNSSKNINVGTLLNKFDNYLSEWETKNSINSDVIIDVHNLELFYRNLSSASIFNDEEQNELEEYVRLTTEQDLKNREKIETSISNGFSLGQKELSEHKISYLSNRRWNSLIQAYVEKKETKVLNIMKSEDLNEKLKDLFSTSKIPRETYDRICRALKLSDEESRIKKLLYKLVDNTPRKKCNQLSYLEDRVTKLKDILIKGNVEIHNLWKNAAKTDIEIQTLNEKILYHCIDNPDVKFASEMLIVDCMQLFDDKFDDVLEKQSILYTEINMLKELAHGNVILEGLCKLIDPNNILLESIRIAQHLITSKTVIEKILSLYQKTGENYENLKDLLNNAKENYAETGEHSHLMKEILQCKDYENYLNLLSHHEKKNEF